MSVNSSINVAAKPAILAVLLVIAVAASGCSSASVNADLINGKTLFVQKCAACHILDRADAKGTAGPNLDQAFVQSRRDGFPNSTFAGVVEQQILYPQIAMPAGLVKGQDARDVAAYVALAAGAPGDDEGKLASAGKPEGGKPVAAGPDNSLELPADPSGALSFASSVASAKAGKVTFVTENQAPVPHNIAIKGPGIDSKGNVVQKGGTSKLTANLKKGKYTFYCSVPGHLEGGMKGILTVK